MENDLKRRLQGGGDLHSLAASVANHVDAMLAYWDKDLICRFANQAYIQWFGRTPEAMIDIIRMQDLLGPLYEKNLPYIRGVLAGQPQTFEREISTPSGIRYSLANYYPDERDGGIQGFFVHVADITQMKLLSLQREVLLEQLTSATQEIKALKGLLPICSWCKKIRDDRGYWNQIEDYLAEHTEASFTHGICSDCAGKVKKT